MNGIENIPLRREDDVHWAFGNTRVFVVFFSRLEEMITSIRVSESFIQAEGEEEEECARVARTFLH
jgi:hypothetical protein